MKRSVGVAAALFVGGGACATTTGPDGSVVSYGIATFACVPGDCSQPDTARIRADCAENLVLFNSTTTVRTFPSPVTCSDSVITRFVHRPPKPVEHRYFQWVVDAGFAPGTYTLQGRMLVAPVNLRPALLFEVR